MTRASRKTPLHSFMDRESALELARRSMLGAPVYSLISLIMLVGTPAYSNYGLWSLLEAFTLLLMGVVRVAFAWGFEGRYDRIGERAVLQFNILTALQSLVLGVLAAIVLYLHWQTREIVLTIVLSAGVIAASTSAMSVRSSAHLIFMICVLGPLAGGVYLAGGAFKAVLIIGYLSLMAFLVQDGGQARRNYTDKLKDYFKHEQRRTQAIAEVQKLGMALEQSQDSIIITDVDGRIEYVNEAFLATTGFSRDEVIGQNPRVKRSDKTPPEVFSEMWATISKGDTWKGEFHSRRKDGSDFVELARIAPVKDDGGQITHYVALLEDITEQRKVTEELKMHRHHLEELVEQRTEELMRQNKEAEAARNELQVAEASNRAKTAFLANMSHEIRTPMNAILGFTHLLLQEDLSPDHRDSLQKIDSSAAHLLSTINDILDLTKIESGKMEMSSADFLLSDLVAQVMAIMREEIQRKGLDVTFEQGDVPDPLRGDATRLRQALLNYVSNAVKFTSEGAIAIRTQQLGERENRRLIQFEVQDSGPGVEAGRLPYLFNAFEQGDTSTTRRYGGTGLGLAITRNIADMMGGNVGAESKLGKGSTFWFTAWLEEAEGDAEPTLLFRPETPADAETQIRAIHSGRIILLVEDNRINQEVAKALLNRAGFEVDTANNGLEALEAVKEKRYDMIIMDVQMPEMDGLEATRAIREMGKGEYAEQLGGIPILAMTAATFEEDRRQAMMAGMNDFVSKPVNPKSLFSAMHKWLKP